jgi:hypothetical protein
MRSKWLDFLFTIAVRGAFGAVLGAIAGLLFCAPTSPRTARHPLLLLVFGNKAHPWRPYFWFGAWALGGAIIALRTTPRWQTPWYRRDAGIVKKSVRITTVSADGERHEYSSLEDVPPEIRLQMEALEKEGIQGKGSESSVVECTQTGNAITLKTTRRESLSVYKIVDESGAERIYHSPEEMPPEIRAAIADAERKPKDEEGAA